MSVHNVTPCLPQATMFRWTRLTSQRSRIVGPNLLATTNLNLNAKKSRISPQIKERIRLENQKFMTSDNTRERRYALCKRCGRLNLTVNFDQLPSARIGLHGTCVDDKDFTHHRMVEVTSEDYKTMTQMDLKKRLTFYYFERGQ